MMVALARYFLIAMAVILAPFYALWIFGGMVADRAERRRVSMLKGNH